MTIKNIAAILSLFIFLSCGDRSNSQANRPEKSSPGFSIINGPRQGTRYVDTSGTTYIYYHVTSIITNDSTIPLQLKINLPPDQESFNDSLKPFIFLTPRRSVMPENQLPDESPQVDLGEISKELKWYLDRVHNIPVSLDTLLNPKGRCVLTFGLLNKLTAPEPAGLSLKSFSEHSSVAALGFCYDRTATGHHVTPCGQIVFAPVKQE